MSSLLCFLLVLLLPLVHGGATVYTQPISLPKKRTLVLLNDLAEKEQYSEFFGLLKSLGQVDFQTQAVNLKLYGEYLYDHAIVFGLKKDITVDLLDFVDAGNNVMIVARPLEAGEDAETALPEYLRDVAIECGIAFSDANIIDYFSNNGSKDSILTQNLIESKPIFPKKATAPIVYRGLAMTLEKHNPLLIPVLTAQSTAFTALDDEEAAPQAIGKAAVLVAGLQTRIGSRITFVGSTSLFEDSAPTPNKDLVKDVLKWTLQLRGVLRYSDVVHSRAQPDGRDVYRIRDWLNYSVKIEEFVENQWTAFKADDIQLEFTMIDPYIRQSLKFDSVRNDGTFNITFQAPDTYGIFKFSVDYRRAGYSPLIFYNIATVRPLRLNEYERYIVAAYPYYASTFSMMFAFIIFGILFLHLKE